MTDKTFIFDLDDTLKNTAQDYSRVVTRFCCYLYEHPQFKFRTYTIRKLLAKIDEINNRDMKKYGRGKDVFPNSLLKTAQGICEENKITLDEQTKEEILKIGYAVFDTTSYEGSMVKGGKEVLDFLKRKKDGLYLVTRGNREEQMKKVRELDITSYFLEIFIPNDDKRPCFEAIGKKAENKEKIYSIGDSINADINQATELGLKAIHVPAPLGGWNDYQVADTREGDVLVKQIEVIKNPEKVLVFKKLEEIVERYDEL